MISFGIINIIEMCIIVIAGLYVHDLLIYPSKFTTVVLLIVSSRIILFYYWFIYNPGQTLSWGGWFLGTILEIVFILLIINSLLSHFLTFMLINKRQEQGI